MSTINRTFSLPEDVDHDVHLFSESRGMGPFVAESIREKLQEKRDQLVKEYTESNTDEAQIEAMKDSKMYYR